MGSRFAAARRVTHGPTTVRWRITKKSKMNEDAECAVCHQPIPKGRVHYGGVSCYSCRAFFRRNTQREELPICKGEGQCRITYMDRKQCSSCRYTKCIRIGMRPEPRYSDDESLSERVHDMPPLEPIEANQKSPFPFPREIPYPYPFQPTTSSMYNQSMYSAKQMNASQDWVRQNAQKKQKLHQT